VAQGRVAQTSTHSATRQPPATLIALSRGNQRSPWLIPTSTRPGADSKATLEDNARYAMTTQLNSRWADPGRPARAISQPLTGRRIGREPSLRTSATTANRPNPPEDARHSACDQQTPFALRWRLDSLWRRQGLQAASRSGFSKGVDPWARSTSRERSSVSWVVESIRHAGCRHVPSSLRVVGHHRARQSAATWVRKAPKGLQRTSPKIKPGGKLFPFSTLQSE